MSPERLKVAFVGFLVAMTALLSVRFVRMHRQAEVAKKIQAEVQVLAARTPPLRAEWMELERLKTVLEQARSDLAMYRRHERDGKEEFKRINEEVETSNRTIQGIVDQIRAVSRRKVKDGAQRAELQKKLMDETRRAEALKPRWSRARKRLGDGELQEKEGARVKAAAERVRVIEANIELLELKAKAAAEKERLDSMKRSLF